MSFGENLVILREDNNLSRRDLAKKLDISYSILSKYETDERFPAHDNLLKIADYFNVSIDYLLGRTKVSKIFHIPDLLIEISKRYNIDYMELVDLSGYIEKREPEIQVYEFEALEKGLNDMISYFKSEEIAQNVVNLSERSQKDLNSYIELLKLRDKN